MAQASWERHKDMWALRFGDNGRIVLFRSARSGGNEWCAHVRAKDHTGKEVNIAYGCFESKTPKQARRDALRHARDWVYGVWEHWGKVFESVPVE